KTEFRIWGKIAIIVVHDHGRPMLVRAEVQVVFGNWERDTIIKMQRVSIPDSVNVLDLERGQYFDHNGTGGCIQSTDRLVGQVCIPHREVRSRSKTGTVGLNETGRATSVRYDG